MDLAPEHNPTPPGITSGRRKQVPYLLLTIAPAAYFAITTRFALTRAFECASIGAIAWCAYRFWTVPMTPRYAAAVERRRRWRAMPITPKMAFGVIGAIVGFYAVLFVAILVLK